MNRSTLPAALAASAALLLTACGGGSGGDKNADHIAGAQTATPTAAPSTAPPPSATPSGPPRPSTALPKDLTMTFDWPKTGNADEDAVLNDGEQYIRSIARVSASHDLKDPSYQFYSRNQALQYANEQIQANVDGGFAPTGLDHYLKPTVDVLKTGSATLSFCENQSKEYSKVVKTGKVLVTGASDRNYVLFNVLLVKDANSNGVWQATQLTVIEGAAQCKP